MFYWHSSSTSDADQSIQNTCIVCRTGRVCSAYPWLEPSMKWKRYFLNISKLPGMEIQSICFFKYGKVDMEAIVIIHGKICLAIHWFSYLNHRLKTFSLALILPIKLTCGDWRFKSVWIYCSQLCFGSSSQDQVEVVNFGAQRCCLCRRQGVRVKASWLAMHSYSSLFQHQVESQQRRSIIQTPEIKSSYENNSLI